jgi:hypothetical protein
MEKLTYYHQWKTELKFFTKRGNLAGIENLIKQRYGEDLNRSFEPLDVILRNCVGCLEIAAEKGHLNIVKYFVNIGYAYVNDPYGSNGCSFAFRSAAKYGHLDVVKYFVEYFENNEISTMKSHLGPGSVFDYNLSEAMFTTVFNNVLSVVKYLVSIGCDFLTDRKHFKLAIQHGSHKVATYLLSLGYDPSQNNYKAFRICNYTGMFEHMLLFLTKKTFYANSEIGKYGGYAMKIISSRIKPMKIFFKHNMLKILLKPTSLHTQLMLIE